jgi:hypothetical protein
LPLSGPVRPLAGGASLIEDGVAVVVARLEVWFADAHEDLKRPEQART